MVELRIFGTMNMRGKMQSVRMVAMQRGWSLLLLLVGFAHVLRAQVPDHAGWDALLRLHVSAAGAVDYAGFIADSTQLDAYLDQLSLSNPAAVGWTADERKAFWINAYNAFTVRLITRHYPLASIRDIGARHKIPFVNTPWDLKFITIAGERLDLNNIEHGKLRAGFGDPRIHFAIVCALVSCPRLRDRAYLAADLDAQLDQAAHDFLADVSRNQLHETRPRLSKLFLWYKGDFSHGQSLIAFINRHSERQISPRARLRYLDYDWSLNGRH